MSRHRLSVLIHTLNEIDQIEDCLRSVEWADEIYLLDSFSTDGTPELVRERFPKVVIEEHEGRGSAAQKNYGMDRLSHDWVLVIDADERVTPALRDEILSILESDPPVWAYAIGRSNIVLGHEVRHGILGYDTVIRLFHRRHARYPNRRVHADLVVDGAVGRLQGRFVHHYIRSFQHMAEKMTRYGAWAAAQLYVEGRRCTPFHIVFHPFWRFLREYVLLAGFLDGTRGVVATAMHVYYTFLKYANLWELTLRERRGEPIELPSFDTDPALWRRPWESDDSGDEAQTEEIRARVRAARSSS